MHTLTTALAQITTEARALFGQGKVADYIPELARVEPRQLGLDITTVDGETWLRPCFTNVRTTASDVQVLMDVADEVSRSTSS